MGEHTHRHYTNSLLLSSGITGTRSRPFPGKVAQNTSSMNKTGVEVLFIFKVSCSNNIITANKILLDFYLLNYLFFFAVLLSGQYPYAHTNFR